MKRISVPVDRSADASMANGRMANRLIYTILLVSLLCQSLFLVHPFLISHSFFLCCSLFLCDSIVSDHDLLASCVLETCFFFARNISLQIFMKHRESCAPLFISIFLNWRKTLFSFIVALNAASDWLSLTFASLCLSHRKNFFVFLSFCNNKPI